MTSSPRLLRKQPGGSRLVVVVYRDHVQFRNIPPGNVKPALRECVGWIVYEDQEYLLIVSDKPVDRDGIQLLDKASSGLLLLKNEVIEVREID